MTKEGLKYVSDFIQIMNSDEYIIRIMKQDYIISMRQEDFNELVLPKDVEGFFCSFTGSNIIEVYDPFLRVLKEMTDKYKSDIDLLFEKAGVYSLHKSIYKSYFDTGIIKREEQLLLSELDYERDRFVTGMVNLILNISDEHAVFILINNANQMCDSTLEVLNRLKDKRSSQLKILLITNETGSTKNYISEDYNLFMKQNDMLGMVVDGEFEEYNREKEKSFVFKNTEEELIRIEDMVNALAIHQAEYYIEMIYQKVEIDKVYVTPDYRMRMLLLYASISIFRENFSYALILCDKFKAVSAESGEKEQLNSFDYYYYKALADMYIGKEQEAIEDALSCLEAAKIIDDDFYILQALLINNMSYVAGWKDVWILSKDIEVPQELIGLCEKYNYVNHLAHIFVYSYHNDVSIYAKPAGIEDRTPYLKKGIELAEKIGNDKFIFEAYRKGVMMASSNGFFATSTYFYMMSVEIVKKNNNKFEEANIYNGLGYDCCTADKFEEANAYYNKALGIFFEEKSNDFILETLYNMGTNAVLAGDYEHAIEYLVAVTNAFKLLKKDRLRVCNISKLWGLIAVSAFKLGNHYLTHLYHGRAEQALALGNMLDCDVEEFKSYLWGDDMFLYHYVSALIATNDGKYEEAFENYDKAEEFMRNRTGSKFLNYVLFAVDKAYLLRITGRDKEAVELLKEAREWFGEHGNVLRVKMFDRYINAGKWETPSMNMDITGVTIEQIMDYMKFESIENEMISKNKQFNFLGTFQELVNKDYDSEKQVIETLVNNFRINFKLDNIMFISCEGEETDIKFNDLEYDISDEEIELMVEYFRANTVGFALSSFTNNHGDYRIFHKIFSKSKISSMIAVPIYKGNKLGSIFIALSKISDNCNALVERSTLDDNDLNVYTIVFRQILGAIEKFKLDEMIKRQAITDELTGLYNRNGYYKILERYVQDSQKSGKGNDAAIMYMDLDNFKYYNDTFGHHLGDEILKKFADIFVNACKKYGYVIRFGGDEFIILLNTTDNSIIQKVIDNVYGQIENEHGFSEFVSRYNNENIVIPENFKATCSIGIEKGNGILSEDEYSELEKHADAALYYGKKTGKGRAVWYSEIA